MNVAPFLVRHLALLSVLLSLWLMGSAAFAADEVFPTVEIGTNKLTNVTILLETPVDLLLKHDKGHLRVKLQDLPEPLKAKYPYDAKKAAAYARANSTSKRLDATALRERQLRASIAQLATQEEAVREKRRVLRGKKGTPDRGKMKNLEEDITELRNQQQTLQAELNQVTALRLYLQQELAQPSSTSSSGKK